MQELCQTGLLEPLQCRAHEGGRPHCLLKPLR